MLNRRYAALLGILAAWSCGSTREETVRAAPAPPGAAANESEATLHAMSQKLASARVFTLRATREIDAALTETGTENEMADLFFEVKRPDRLHIVSRTKNATQHLYFDGQSVVLYNETDRIYATLPVTGPIDTMINALHDNIGYIPPLAQFILNDSWPAFHEQMGGGGDAVREPIGGVECQRVRLMGMRAIAYIWVAPRNSLPCALTATFADVEGDPQVRVKFLEWNFAPQLPDATFRFTPPAGVRAVPMDP